MRTLETLSPEHYKKASDDSTFGQIWEDHWGKGLVMDGNLLSVNANLLKRGDRIVVLNEYVDTVKKIEADMRTGSLGCLVVGTPGIGKSTFLPYLLLLLISRGQSVVYFKRECNIFTSDGVFIPRNNSVLMKPLFHGIPALVDADSAQGLELFSDGTMKVYTVLVSSPKEDRIKNYQKEREAAVFVPKAPSRDEAFAVWNLNFSDRVPELQKDLELAWKFYGPDFRIGFELLNSHKTLEEYHTMMKKLISALPKADLKKYISRPDSDKLITHRCIETYSSSTSITGFIYRLRSRTVLRMITAAMTIEDLRERRELFELFQSSGRLSVSRGYLFEVIADEMLSRGFQGSLIPEHGGARKELNLAYSRMKLFSNKSQPNTTITDGRFYVPLQGENPTYDAFCYQNRVGFVFQHTAAHTHEFSLKGLKDLNARFNAARVAERIFIFVIPKDTAFNLPTLPVRRGQWKYFTLELDVDDYDRFRSDYLEVEREAEEDDEDEKTEPESEESF